MEDKAVLRVLNEQIELIKPSEETLDKINRIYKEFVKELRELLRKKKIKAEVFLGGSLAKDSLVKKDIYDIDIYVRFDKKYDNKKISGMLGKVVKNAKKIHGSRDYFQLKKDGILIEVIPVLKISKQEDALNVTDLSYFHVKYIVNKIKKDKGLVDEIRLAKNFTYAQNSYGAESYIKGFSGYALELLIIHYGSFIKFVREIAGYDIAKLGNIVIDDAGFYKNREQLLLELNDSKKQGPIVLIDPTFKERNSLSGLSKETLFKFQNSCRNFLKNPSKDFFVKKKVSDEFRQHKNVRVFEVRTNKQPGDIAGTKSKKFFGFVERKVKREFELRKSGFEYNEVDNKARFYFVLSKKKDEIIRGPSIDNKKNLERFRKAHKNNYVKKGYVFAKIKHELLFDDWYERFMKKEKKVMEDMGIRKIEKK